MNFTEIADTLGYSSIYYFSRQFKKRLFTFFQTEILQHVVGSGAVTHRIKGNVNAAAFVQRAEALGFVSIHDGDHQIKLTHKTASLQIDDGVVVHHIEHILWRVFHSVAPIFQIDINLQS